MSTKTSLNLRVTVKKYILSHLETRAHAWKHFRSAEAAIESRYHRKTPIEFTGLAGADPDWRIFWPTAGGKNDSHISIHRSTVYKHTEIPTSMHADTFNLQSLPGRWTSIQKPGHIIQFNQLLYITYTLIIPTFSQMYIPNANIHVCVFMRTKPRSESNNLYHAKFKSEHKHSQLIFITTTKVAPNFLSNLNW